MASYYGVQLYYDVIFANILTLHINFSLYEKAVVIMNPLLKLVLDY